MPTGLPFGREDYGLFQKGRWSSKRRMQDSMDWLDRLNQTELERARATADIDVDRAGRVAEAQERVNLPADLTRKYADSIFQRQATQETLDQEARLRGLPAGRAESQTITGLALPLLGQVNPVTGEPYTPAEAQAKGHMMMLEGESLPSLQAVEQGVQTRARMPFADTIGTSQAETILDRDFADRMNARRRANTDIGIIPFAERLGASGADLQIKLDDARYRDAEVALEEGEQNLRRLKGRAPWVFQLGEAQGEADVETARGRSSIGRMIQDDPALGFGGVASARERSAIAPEMQQFVDKILGNTAIEPNSGLPVRIPLNAIPTNAAPARIENPIAPPSASTSTNAMLELLKSMDIDEILRRAGASPFGAAPTR